MTLMNDLYEYYKTPLHKPLINYVKMSYTANQLLFAMMFSHWITIARRHGYHGAKTVGWQRGKGGGVMNDLDDLSTFLGAAGCLYVKANLCTPFRLREYAEAWRMDGISLVHCLEQIRSHLAKNSGQYRNGSGDWGLRWLDEIIRKSWHLLNRPPRALPARTDRLYRRGATDEVEEDQWFVDPTDLGAPMTVRPVDLKPIDKAGSGREPREVPSHPGEGRISPRSVSGRSDAAPNPARPVRQKQIEQAEAFLRRELADGEVEALIVEEKAKAEGIGIRTLARARALLKVVSRRRGFGKNGQYWLALPTAGDD